MKSDTYAIRQERLITTSTELYKINAYYECISPGSQNLAGCVIWNVIKAPETKELGMFFLSQLYTTRQKSSSIWFQNANLSLAQRISASFSVIWKRVNACLPGCYLGCGEADLRCLRWLRGWDRRLMILLPAPQGRDPQLSDPKPNKK